MELLDALLEKAESPSRLVEVSLEASDPAEPRLI